MLKLKHKPITVTQKRWDTINCFLVFKKLIASITSKQFYINFLVIITQLEKIFTINTCFLENKEKVI